jgi:hypothetical protein
MFYVATAGALEQTDLKLNITGRRSREHKHEMSLLAKKNNSNTRLHSSRIVQLQTLTGLEMYAQRKNNCSTVLKGIMGTKYV